MSILLKCTSLLGLIFLYGCASTLSKSNITSVTGTSIELYENEPAQEIIYFEANSTELNEEFVDRLASLAPLLSSYESVRVIGHTDTNGSASKNRGLSEMRANAVSDILISKGVPKQNLVREGKGETEPFVDTADGVIEQLNNRVELTFMKEPKLNKCQRSGPGFDCVPVFFGTSRQRRSGDSDTAKQDPYGPVIKASGRTPTYGEILITVPTKHRPGAKIETLDERRHPTDGQRRKYFTVWNWEYTDELEEPEFMKRSQYRVSKAKVFENQAFVFIHGYNTTFRSAAFQTAQIKSDIGFDGPAYFFSWPANGNKGDYLSDQDDADASADYLYEFLKTVKKSLGDDVSLNVIAHSMGNRIFAQVIDKMSNLRGEDKIYFDKVIFAHADLDQRLFNQWVLKPNDPLATKFYNEGVFYTSSDDKPLGLSKFIRSPFAARLDPKFRLGLSRSGVPKAVFKPPLYTVDLSSIKGGFFDTNHSKYTEKLPAICHIGELFRETDITEQSLIRAAQRNSVLEQGLSDLGRRYWKMSEKPDWYNCYERD